MYLCKIKILESFMKNVTLNSIKPFVRFCRRLNVKDYNSYPYAVKCYDARLYYCIEGSGNFMIANEVYEIKAGTAILFPALTEYSYLPSSDNPMSFIAINFDYTYDFCNIFTPIPPSKTSEFKKEKSIDLVNFLDVKQLNSPIILKKMKALEPKFLYLEEEFNKRQSYFEARCSATLLDVISSMLLRNDIVSQNKKNRKISDEIIEYLNAHYTENITLNSLGAEFGYHPNYLNQLFINATKKTIYSYLLDLRILKAIKLLQNSDLTVSDVCEKTGFCDISHFSKTFKKKTGYNPSDFRII